VTYHWNPLGSAILQACRLRGDAVALVSSGHEWTFAAVGSAVSSLAGALASRFEVDTVVGIISSNSAEYMIADQSLIVSALARLGLNKRLHPAEAIDSLRRAGARAVFADAAWLGSLTEHGLADTGVGLAICLDDLPADVGAILESRGIETATFAQLAGSGDRLDAARSTAPGALATLNFTSGTTGVPKCVAHSRSAQLAISRGMSALTAAHSSDILLLPLPLSHAGGLFSLAYFLAGGTQHIIDRIGNEELLDLAHRVSATALASVPTVLAPLSVLARERELSLAFRRIYFGGAPMRPDVVLSVLQAFGPVLTQLYGQSESGLPVTAMIPLDYERALSTGSQSDLMTAGRPWGLVEVVVLDDEGHPASPDQVGEIAVRGETVMAGYLGDEDATSAAFDADGWLLTGDLGAFSPDGVLSVVGRRRDVIITGGFNVYPAEVEAAIAPLASVRDVVVLGVPDEVWGESVCAVVVAAPGASVDRGEVIAACEKRLGRFKVPRVVRLASGFPVGATGKVDKRALLAVLDIETKPL